MALYPTSSYIHPSSVVEADVTLGESVYIGPFCHLKSGVRIGDRTQLFSHVVVEGECSIGTDNLIYPFSTLGMANQDLKYGGEKTTVTIGNHNIIREHVTIHRGTILSKTRNTYIGDRNLLMVNTHIAHDCLIKNHCVLANGVTLGGHVQIDDFAVLGGLTAVHQFCLIGTHAMIGGCSGIRQDVPPFLMAQGAPAKPFGLNYRGLKRRGFTAIQLQQLRKIYRALYRSPTTLEEIKNLLLSEEVIEPILAEAWLSFFHRSTRGIIR